MKLKNWVLWLCVAALLATEVFLFQAKSQRDKALVLLRESQQQAMQLRSDLDQLRTSSVNTLSAENSRLRAENQGLTQKLTQLQSTSSQLRGQNQKLTQQLEAAHTAVQQQQQQLQQLELQNQQAAAQPDATSEPSAATVNQLNACINNLRQIDAAKQQWALGKRQNRRRPFPPPRICCRISRTTCFPYVLPAALTPSMPSACRRPVPFPVTSCRSDARFFDFHSWLSPFTRLNSAFHD